MKDIIELDPRFSTTRCMIKADPQEMAEVVKQSNKPEDKFETVLFLPEGEGRQGEGGLRTKGYFKQTQDDKPLITVVTVVYNGEQFLEETILSIINQTYDNVEYIIIDGGSTDGTLDIIRKYEHAIDYWVSEKDKGIYDAMNKGITLSLGEFIGFVNADDFIYQNTLWTLGYATQENQFDYTVGPVEIVDISGEPKEKMQVLHNFTDNKNFLFNMATPHQSFYISQNLLKKIGLFNLNYKLRADFDMVIRAVSMSKRYFEFNESVGAFREGGVSGSYDTFYENFELLKSYNVSLAKRLKFTLPSLFKVFIIKNFLSFIVLWLRKIFSSGRYVKVNKS